MRAVAAAAVATLGIASCSPALDAPSTAAACPEVQAIRVSVEHERDVLRDRAPEVPQLSIAPSSATPGTAVTVIATGSVLGGMDSPAITTAAVCDARGVLVTATTTRSADYRGAVQKTVLWRPRLEIVLVPRPRGTQLTMTWHMRLTTGAEVPRASTPPYPEQRYPLTVTALIRPPDH